MLFEEIEKKAIKYSNNTLIIPKNFHYIYIYYKANSNLPFENPEFIIDIQYKIRCETNNND